jgi:lipopolysaccharide/colanic/teichoic acid biosynthesis glycosyltransferase
MSTVILPDRSSLESPPSHSSGHTIATLDDLVTEYQDDVPTTPWVKRLELIAPRVNLECLPVSARVIKRFVDVVGASVLLILVSPLMLLTGLLVAITSPGSVIYRQTRVGLNLRQKRSPDRRQAAMLPPDQSERRRPGRDRREVSNYGRLFTIYKFRTMRSDAEKNGVQFATNADPRITPIGWLLRRTRIDELPQLWNVIKGDMSLVGPRPERPEFMEQLSVRIPRYVDRLGLKPGLTGIAQVENGYDNELEGFRRKVGYDLLYLQNCCLINDLKILFRTIRVVITGHGAL